MDSSLRSKSSTSLKSKPTLIKELQKIAKQTATPTSRRSLLKNIIMPQTTRAMTTGKSYEALIQKSKVNTSRASSSNKKTTPKSSSKTPIKELSPRLKKKNSETLINPLKKSESSIKKPSTPRSSLKFFKSTPKSGSSQLKKSLIVLSKSKRSESRSKINEKIITSTSYRSRIGTIGGKQKPQNQDEYLIVKNYAQCKSQTLLGVMDGHGIYGHEVSSFVKKQLPLLVENNLPYEVTSSSDNSIETLDKIHRAFTLGYVNTHKTLINKRVIDINYSGTTSITALIRDKTVICANVGDSRAIIGRHNEMWYPVELSHDHKPSDKYEKQRIEAAGGRVEPYRESGGQFIGPDRVWLQHEQLPGLAMSRSIGDLVAAHVGVIAEPDIIIHELTPHDKFIVIATDGVWEFISNQQCVNIISEFFDEGNIEKAADMLMQKAIERWNDEDNVVDDITFVIAFFNVK